MSIDIQVVSVLHFYQDIESFICSKLF